MVISTRTFDGSVVLLHLVTHWGSTVPGVPSVVNVTSDPSRLNVPVTVSAAIMN